MTDKRPFPLPTGYFAIPLGLSALSLAWLHMGDTLSFSRNVSDIIGLISVSVWALFVLLYIYKMIYFSHEVRDEYCCPIRFSFLALIPITTMLSGDVLYRWFPLIGEGLIWIGTIGNCCLLQCELVRYGKMAHLRKNRHCHHFICPLLRLISPVPHH